MIGSDFVEKEIWLHSGLSIYAMEQSSNRCAVPGSEIGSLKETLCSQQQLLQKLYSELDKEREFSASAVSEAMSMIHRLQEEKAAVSMELNQYKRMAEEKMCLAEESLAIFEDVMYQKEMEISSLEFRIQAYRCKLLSLGYSDIVMCENLIAEDLSLDKNDSLMGDVDLLGNIRRNNSLHPILLKDLRRSSVERERSPIPGVADEDAYEEGDIHVEIKSGNSTGGDSYWDQICKLDEQVKEISECRSSGTESANPKDAFRPFSLLSRESPGTSYEPKSEGLKIRYEEVKHPGNLIEKEAIVNSPCSSGVLDVFEVPQSNEPYNASRFNEKKERKSVLEMESRLRKAYTVSQETLQMRIKNDTDLVKKLNKPAKLRHGTSVDSQLPLVHPSVRYSEYQAEVQQLSRRIENLEVERNNTRHEISNDGEEGVRLLKEIREQLNSIQLEMRNLRTMKSSPPDDTNLLTLMEAMLHFWL